MGNKMSQTICCSARDKNERTRGLPRDHTSRFWCMELELQIDEPRLTAFAPLWCGESAQGTKRRIALASNTEVHVYSLAEDHVDAQLALEHWLTLKPNQGVVNVIHFTEETLSRHLAVAFGPQNGHSGHMVRIFGCEETSERRAGKPWDTGDIQACVASLDDHKAPISRIVTNPTYLLTADVAGEAFVWQKSRSFLRRASQNLHSGGVADLAADRLFAYSAGVVDKCIRVWSMPELELRNTVNIEIPQVLLSSLPEPLAEPNSGEEPSKPVASMSASAAPYRLLRITSLRRPLSRWAGSQGSARRTSTPKGTLYIAGVLTYAADDDAAVGTADEQGAGVLMEWSLGLEPMCQCAQIAHDTPIAALVYGPYDNGPLITADARGTVRVWDCVPRLGCSQQVRINGNALDECQLAMVVEPQHGIYITVGDRRLFVWRRSQPGGEQMEPI